MSSKLAKAFEIKDGDLGYGKNVILSKVNISANQGELIGILGCSGAGKSTLLAALSGAKVQISGSLLVNGIDPRNSAHPIGLVPQLGDEHITNLSLLELVTLGAPRRGLFTSRAERKEALEVLERLGLAGFENNRLDELSGGQRQRVAIARALTSSSKLLLCDEPTSGADPVLTHEIISVLAEIAESGSTVIIATHDLFAVAPRLSRIIGLGESMIKYDGTVANFTPEVSALIYKQYLSSSEKG